MSVIHLVSVNFNQLSRILLRGGNVWHRIKFCFRETGTPDLSTINKKYNNNSNRNIFWRSDQSRHDIYFSNIIQRTRKPPFLRRITTYGTTKSSITWEIFEIIRHSEVLVADTKNITHSLFFFARIMSHSGLISSMAQHESVSPSPHGINKFYST